MRVSSPLGLLFFTLLIGATAQAAPPITAPPRLVVLVSVDQFRYDYLPRIAPHLPPGGIQRLLSEGALHTDAHYEYGTTYTAPGHALLVTGTYPYRNGIVGNAYFDPTSSRMVKPCEDPQTQLTGIEEERPGSSPRKLLASTVGDELRLAYGADARTIAIAFKPRVSVLLAGQLGRAVWFDRKTGRFVSSSYYGALPEWLRDFNELQLPDGDFGKRWERRGPENAFADCTADDASWEENAYGLGRTFPHRIEGSHNTRDRSFYSSWTLTPYAMQAQLRLVRAAVESEQLGADETPDFLAVGLSTLDYVGHSYGPYSHEITSTLFDVDAAVRDLLTFLDEKVGPENYLVAFTADHGVAAVPEHLQSLGVDAGRVFPDAVKTAINAALLERYGEGEWLGGLKLPLVALNHAQLRSHNHSIIEATNLAAEAVRKLPGIAQVFTRETLLSQPIATTRLGQQITRGFHSVRSGDLYVLPRTNWVWGYRDHRTGTGHGTPYRYDTHVPLILSGPGIRPGVYSAPISLVDLAPTLSHLLGTGRPNQCEGRVLSESLLP